MDAITLLKNDHHTVETLFTRFEKSGERAFVKKRQLVDQITEELSRHAAIEEQLFYPTARATVPGTDDLALEALEEHHIVKWVLAELESMSPEDERFDAKVTVLIENVRHHIREEEDDFFPKVRAELSRGALADLGEALATAKKAAPTHPHPRTPDTPPGNLVMGAAAGVADKIGDTVSGLAQGSVTAAGDVIATVLKREKPRVSPTGSTTTRKTAETVRTDVADATDAVIERTKKSSATARRKAGATKGAAKRSAASATRGTRTAATNAASSATSTKTSARKSAKKSVRKSVRKSTTKSPAAAKRSKRAA